MRYRGRGVGHLATRQCNEVLLADKHTPFVENSSTSAAHMGDQFGETDEEQADEDEAGDDTEEDNDDQLAGARHDVDIFAVAGFAAL